MTLLVRWPNQQCHSHTNKCIEDDTKAAARWSPNCIRKTSREIRQKRFLLWRMEFYPAMWHMALGWHDIEFARWQHPAVWHVALGWHTIEFAQMSAILEFYFRFQFWPYHHSRRVILHQWPVSEILSKLDLPRQKNDVMLIFKMADLRHLGF